MDKVVIDEIVQTAGTERKQELENEYCQALKNISAAIAAAGGMKRFCEIVGVSNSAVCHWKAGRRKINHVACAQINTLARILHERQKEEKPAP
jgi:hypothetical protein